MVIREAEILIKNLKTPEQLFFFFSQYTTLIEAFFHPAAFKYEYLNTLFDYQLLKHKLKRKAEKGKECIRPRKSREQIKFCY